MRELLLLLCHYPFEEKNRELLTKLLREIQDWPKTVNLINDHGIIALAAYNIKEAGLEKEIPEDAMAVLGNGYLKSVVRNAWLTERWKEVKSILSNAGIKHVLLKGMALEHTLYGSKGLRQMNDNDILVKKEEALKAWYILQEHGFKPEIIKSFLHKKIITEIGKHLPALTRDDYSIEIHHRLFEDPEANEQLSDAIITAEEIMIDGIKGYIPGKKIHQAFLKEHLLKHLQLGEAQLRLYTDLELIEPGSAPPIPEGFIENPTKPAGPDARKNTYRKAFYSLPLRHRSRYLAGDLFPSLAWMKKRHGCSGMKAILYYPRRFGKLGWLM